MKLDWVQRAFDVFNIFNDIKLFICWIVMFNTFRSQGSLTYKLIQTSHFWSLSRLSSWATEPLVNPRWFRSIAKVSSRQNTRRPSGWTFWRREYGEYWGQISRNLLPELGGKIANYGGLWGIIWEEEEKIWLDFVKLTAITRHFC